MSYCRWSSDDFRCDLYSYADVSGGWTTHVARSRVTGDIIGTHLEDLSAGQIDAILFGDVLVDIGLPYDGHTFNDPTLEAFRARIVMLRAAGYSCPDHVLDRIDEEIKAAGEA